MVRKRKWGTSNTFSESHRNSLPGNFCLFDIDGVSICEGGKVHIYEEKYNMKSKDRGNFIDTLYDRRNVQGGFLIKASTYCEVWIREKKTNKWWSLVNENLIQCETPDIDFINTENKIYVQDILNFGAHNFSAAILRTEGDKKSQYLPILEAIASTFSIPKVLVNDVHKKGFIYFKNDFDKIVEVSENEKWSKVWKDLGII